jgi:beta-glucosidase
VLLKNDAAGEQPRALPLRPGSRVFVSGSGANDLTRQCGGWTITWQGDGSNTAGTTLQQAVARRATVTHDIETADAVVVVLAEPSYAEWFGDDLDIEFDPADVAALRRARESGKPTVAVMFSGRPMIITEHLALADAWLAAWLPGSEGDGVADVLFGDSPPTGKLSHSWPRSVAQLPLLRESPGYDPLFPFGFGLTYDSPAPLPRPIPKLPRPGRR